MKITDFEVPTEHPWGMLDGLGLKDVHEAESLLAFILMRCIEASEFIAVYPGLKHSLAVPPDLLPSLVEAGLLQESVTGYILTENAVDLLYGYYEKKEK